MNYKSKSSITLSKKSPLGVKKNDTKLMSELNDLFASTSPYDNDSNIHYSL